MHYPTLFAITSNNQKRSIATFFTNCSEKAIDCLFEDKKLAENYSIGGHDFGVLTDKLMKSISRSFIIQILKKALYTVLTVYKAFFYKLKEKKIKRKFRLSK